MLSIPKYIKISIFEHLSLKTLLNLRLVCKSLASLITENKWINIKIRPNVKYLENIIKVFNFSNFSFCSVNITGDHLKLLKYKCNIIEIFNCDQVTNDDLIFLENCHTISLPYNNDGNITGECTQYLKKYTSVDLTLNKYTFDSHISNLRNCHTVNLSNTSITDKGAKLLCNCHTLILAFTRITDESVKLFGNCHTLDISCTFVTDESMKYLSNCHSLDISDTGITDNGIKFLGNCNTLKIRTNPMLAKMGHGTITDYGMKYLVNCQNIDISGTKITDNGIISLVTHCNILKKKPCELNLTKTKVTDKSVALLGDYHTLHLDQTNVTDKSLELLDKCNTIYVTDTKVSTKCKTILRNKGVCVIDLKETEKSDDVFECILL